MYVIKEQKISREFEKLEHYNHYNKIYSEWYKRFLEQVDEKTRYEDLDNKEKGLIREYFNLYSQEYYMYKNDMIPKEMWENVIHGPLGNCNAGAIVNLRNHPILIAGYKDWAEKGAFRYPDDFKKILAEKLHECGLS